MTKRIGIMASAEDSELVAEIIADDGAAVRFDRLSAHAAIRAGELALLIVAPDVEGGGKLPDITALNAAAARHPVAILALIPRGDAVTLGDAFDAGAADCAGFPIDSAELRTRVRALLRRTETSERLRADADESRRLAHTDPLTGMWNRHYFDAELAAALTRATSLATPLSLLMIDIDGFKTINDQYGHATGDCVLLAIGQAIDANIRGIDILARIGGDELVVVMPDIGRGVALGVAERLRALVADTPVAAALKITISIGVAELSPGESARGLMAKADTALYAAKGGGRNRVAEAA